jgi:hypothetical protein
MQNDMQQLMVAFLAYYAHTQQLQRELDAILSSIRALDDFVDDQFDSLFFLCPRLFRASPVPQPRTADWFDSVVPLLSEASFRQCFRLTRATTSRLYRLLYDCTGEAAAIAHRQAVGGRPPTMTFDKKLLVTLYRLGTGSAIPTIAHLFGCSPSDVVRACDVIISAIVEHIFPREVTVR